MYLNSTLLQFQLRDYLYIFHLLKPCHRPNYYLWYRIDITSITDMHHFSHSYFYWILSAQMMLILMYTTIPSSLPRFNLIANWDVACNTNIYIVLLRWLLMAIKMYTKWCGGYYHDYGCVRFCVSNKNSIFRYSILYLWYILCGVA